MAEFSKTVYVSLDVHKDAIAVAYPRDAPGQREDNLALGRSGRLYASHAHRPRDPLRAGFSVPLACAEAATLSARLNAKSRCLLAASNLL